MWAHFTVEPLRRPLRWWLQRIGLPVNLTLAADTAVVPALLAPEGDHSGCVPSGVADLWSWRVGLAVCENVQRGNFICHN